jgi:hypothetical protein
VAHPDGLALALLPHAGEQRAIADDFKLCAAELAMLVWLHLAAQLLAHRLLAVADAEHRQVRAPHDIGSERTALDAPMAVPTGCAPD